VRGPYSDYAPPPIYVYPSASKPHIRFSRTEIFQLSVAILALAGAFTVLFVRSNQDSFLQNPGLYLAIYFPTALLAVGTGVGLHEIMHKAVAQRYGYWAEFRYNLQGLLLAFVFAFIGFIFGAPGATWISGAVTPEQNGKISAAGPLTNLTIGGVFLAGLLAFSKLASLGPLSNPFTSAFLPLALTEVTFINVVLAGFNMIPIMPLDGAKVWRWNKAVYLGIVALAVFLIYFVFVGL
jgi:Zn-dependent protease